jgi:CubicO group peptidase (beta-lactamase class C family)
VQSVALVAPLLPGKTEIDRAALQSCANGERTAAHQASRKRHGITREAVWIQSTPAGDFAVVYLETDDLQAAFAGLSTSADPFDSWFREHTLDALGLDLTHGFPPPDQALDYRRARRLSSRAARRGSGGISEAGQRVPTPQHDIRVADPPASADVT